MYKKPKNDDKYQWTNHSVEKMAYYRISESLVKRIVRFPKRTESGIAPGTTACMSPYGHASGRSTVGVERSAVGRQPYRGEIWVMYVAENQKSKIKNQNDKSKFKIKNLLKIENLKLKIISAWRYPGVSKVGEPIPIPEDVLESLQSVDGEV